MDAESRMHRMQFYIPVGLRDDLARLAARRGVSMAKLIRDAVEDLVQRETAPASADPALDIVGMLDWPNAPDDAATNHDRYIYRKDWKT